MQRKKRFFRQAKKEEPHPFVKPGFRMTFLGACREVGRSCLLVEAGGKTILIDAGIKLGPQDQYPALEKGKAKHIDAIVISHAHLDHTAYLPHLFADGYRGPIYSTKPTRDLTQLLLADYHRICKAEKKRSFTQRHLNECMKSFKFLEHGKKHKIFPDVFITLHRAGHILGASGVRLQHGETSLYFTGDFSMKDSSLLYKADTNIEPFDFLIMESTYGGRENLLPSLKFSANKLCGLVNQTIKRGGKALIPTFGVGRGQEVMIIVDNYMKSGLIPEVPAYLDGMVRKANRIYRQNVLWLREEIPNRILLAEEDPFKSPFFHEPKTRDRSDVMKRSCAIIISTSGMLTGGPSLEYFKKLANDDRNSIILVGYQAPGTPGRALQDGEKVVEVPIKKQVHVKAHVDTIHLSAHADRQQLMDFVMKVPKPKEIFVVHGEEERSLQFAADLVKKGFKATVPHLGQTFNL
jgi:hypothetical protein